MHFKVRYHLYFETDVERCRIDSEHLPKSIWLSLQFGLEFLLAEIGINQFILKTKFYSMVGSCANSIKANNFNYCMRVRNNQLSVKFFILMPSKNAKMSESYFYIKKKNIIQRYN